MLIVLTTCPAHAEAAALAKEIVEERLAACVQVMPQMTSVYVWEGQVQEEGEHLLIIKTLPDKWNELRDFIAANHSYEVPEIVAIDAEKISGAYLEWMKRVIE
jgi:periplasmic divalent cation tolerance protein